MPKMPKRFPLHRVRIGKDIIAECALPPTKTLQRKGRVAILLLGVPSSPGKGSVIEFLARQGFYVIVPRYRGTWESSGSFLQKEPTEDVRIVMDALRGPLTSLWTGEKLMFPENPAVFLFASSFGGPAGILLSRDERIHAVVAFSPVVDWTMRSKAEPLEEAFDFIKLAYGEGYRMKQQNFEKLGKTAFYDPTKQMTAVSGNKVMIFHAEDDESVPFSTVARFCKESGSRLIRTKKGGHFGLDEIQSPNKWLKIKKFIGV